MPSMSSGGSSEVQRDTTTVVPWMTNSNFGQMSTSILVLESKTSNSAQSAQARGKAIVDIPGGNMNKCSRNDRAVATSMLSSKKAEGRKKLKCMFSELRTLIPNLPVESDKDDIVEGTVNYIKHLQGVLQNLEQQKQESIHAQAALPSRELVMADMVHGWNASAVEMTVAAPMAVASPQGPPAFHTWSTPNVVLNVAGDDAHINICVPRRQCVLSAVLFVLEKHRIEVVSKTVSSNESCTIFMIHAHINQPPNQLSNKVISEEIYKAAVSEMMTWLPN